MKIKSNKELKNKIHKIILKLKMESFLTCLKNQVIFIKKANDSIAIEIIHKDKEIKSRFQELSVYRF